MSRPPRVLRDHEPELAALVADLADGSTFGGDAAGRTVELLETVGWLLVKLVGLTEEPGPDPRYLELAREVWTSGARGLDLDRCDPLHRAVELAGQLVDEEDLEA